MNTNFIGKIREYFKNVLAEIKKVSWPDKKMVTFSTILILVIVFFVTIYVNVIDFVMAKVFAFLTSVVKG